MSGHTPAPWKVATFDGPNEYASIEAGNEINELVRICDIPSWPCATNEMEANARLIASAPDLLSALERLAHPMADDDDLDYARAIIRKAKGQQ